MGLTSSFPTQNRVCYACVAYDLTLRVDLLFLHNASTIQRSNLPASVSSLYAQTLCEIVGLRLVDHWQAIQYSARAVFLATSQPDIGGPFAPAPDPALDLAGVLESALHLADSAAVSASRRGCFSRCGL